jgi:hypothetical protein
VYAQASALVSDVDLDKYLQGSTAHPWQNAQGMAAEIQAHQTE